MDSYTYPSDSPPWADPITDRVRERLEQSERTMWLSHPERADPPLPPNALQNVLQAQAQALNSPSTSSLRLDLGLRVSPRFDDDDTLPRHASSRRGVPSLPDLRRSAHASPPLSDADASDDLFTYGQSHMPPMPADAALHVAKAKEQVARAPSESRLSMRRFSSDDSTDDEIPSPYERPPTPHSLVRRTRASPLPNGSTLPLEPWEKSRSPPRMRPALRRTVSTVTIVRKTSSRVVPEAVPFVPSVPPIPVNVARSTPKPPTPPQPGLADWTSALDTLDAFEPRSLGLWGDPEPDMSAGTVLVHDDSSSESAFEAPLKSPPVPREPNQSQIRLLGGAGAADSPRAGSVGSPWPGSPISSPTQRRVVSDATTLDAARTSTQTLTRGASTPRAPSTPRVASSSERKAPTEPVSAPVVASERMPVAELQRLSLSLEAQPAVHDDAPSVEDKASTVETAGPTPPSKDHALVQTDTAAKEAEPSAKPQGDAPAPAPAAPADEPVETRAPSKAAPATPQESTSPRADAPAVATPTPPVPRAGIEGPWSVFASPLRMPAVPTPEPRTEPPVPPVSLPNTPTRQRSPMPPQAAPTPPPGSVDASPTKSSRPNSNPFRRPGSTSSRADLSSHSSEPPPLGPDASPAAVAGAAAFFQRRLQDRPSLPTIGPSPDVSGVARTHDDPDASTQTMPGGGPFVPEPPSNEWAGMMLEPQDDSEMEEDLAVPTPRQQPVDAFVSTPPLSPPATARELAAQPGTLSPPLTTLASSPVLRMLGSPTQDVSPHRAVDTTPTKGAPLPVQSTPPAPATPSHASKTRTPGASDSPTTAVRRGPSMAVPGAYVPSVSTSHPPATPTASPSTRGKSAVSPTRSTPSAAPAPTSGSPPRAAKRTARDYPGLQPQASLVAPFELQNRSLVLPTGPDVKRPPGGFCLECMMRDEDMIDVKVDDPAVWERESDTLFYDAIRWEHKVREKGIEPSNVSPLRHPTLGTPLTHVSVRQVASGDPLTVVNLREHTATSRLSSAAKARTVQLFVKQQRRILGLDDAQERTRTPAPAVPPPVVGATAWPAYLSPVLSASPQPNPYATPPLSGSRAAAPVTLATIASQASHGAPASPVQSPRSPSTAVPSPAVPSPAVPSPARTPLESPPMTDARAARKSSESVRRRPPHSSPDRPGAHSPMRSPKRRDPGARRNAVPASPTSASPRPARTAPAPVPALAPADAGEPDSNLASELSMDDGPDDTRKKQGQPLRSLFRKKTRTEDSDSVRSRRRPKNAQVSPDLSMDDDDTKSFWKRLSRSPKSNSSHKSGRFASVKMPPPPPVPPVPPSMSPGTQPST
ncbi:hypothetical protein MCAP1_001684 [Malassezia caprae]|uniref:Uncharacterized protein n=1 Tax=Malassezia caprae TaxID=1381934 RepID=A0AAF0E6Z4_9BASI|nr:hypothetical protein MCAP1_001684 [Malassezia caprae]